MNHVDLKYNAQFLDQEFLGSTPHEGKPNKNSSMTSGKCSNQDFPQKGLKSSVLDMETKIAPRGPTTWKDMQRNAQNVTASWQTQTSNSAVMSLHLVSTNTSSRRRNWKRWENCQKKQFSSRF